MALWMDNVSRREDAMIMGAWGAHEKGWPEVQARYQWAGFRDSATKLTVEYLSSVQSGDLAFPTAIERADVKVAGRTRPRRWGVTHIFRKEDGAWKLVLRHADPLGGGSLRFPAMTAAARLPSSLKSEGLLAANANHRPV
jgi:ketosteroid isomerase-like protein